MANTFKADGKTYEYKFLGNGPWTLECASLDNLKKLVHYMSANGLLGPSGEIPAAVSDKVEIDNTDTIWASDVAPVGHYIFFTYGGDNYDEDDMNYARYSVVCLDG